MAAIQILFIGGMIAWLGMAGIDYRGGAWFRAHWLGVTLRFALPLMVLGLSAGLLWRPWSAGHSGVTLSAVWRLALVFVFMLGLYHGVFGLFIALADLDGDNDEAAALRGRLDLMTLIGCLVAACGWWALKGGPPMPRSVAALSAAWMIGAGVWPTGDPAFVQAFGPWASGVKSAFGKALGIGLGVWLFYYVLTHGSSSPIWQSI